MKIEYYDASRNHHVHFRGGKAWWVRGDPDRPWDEHFGEFVISVQLSAALWNLDIIEFFQTLPNDGWLEDHEEGILLVAGLKEAATFVRARSKSIGTEQHEWDDGQQLSPDVIQYVIVPENNTLEIELNAFAEFLESGGAQGWDVQLWL